MIGKDARRRSAYLAALVLAAVLAFAFPALAAADTTSAGEAAAAVEEGGAVLEPVPTTPAQALAFWTRPRLEAAVPLPPVVLPGEAPEAPRPAREGAQESAQAGPQSARTAALAAAATGVGGVEITGDESKVFPNSANGKVYGVFGISPPQLFECSGSLVSGNLVLTAGHCVINPETGARAMLVIFMPGYNEQSEPYGTAVSTATDYVFTKSWEQTAKPGSIPNEGNDLALLKMRTNVEATVGGALKIAFDQSCNQTYTQYGYPAEKPYDGEVLYSHVAPYLGPDTNPLFSPTPMKIQSDFTKGASGGPWTVGPSSAPTVLSLTAYSYESQPGYLYGPYFGEVARKAYELALGRPVPIGIEETCKPLEPPVVHPPAPAPAPPSAAPAAPTVRLRVTRVRRRANGSAVLTAKVSTAGELKLSGTAVRAESLSTQAAGKYRLIVAPKGKATRRLKRAGRTKVGVRVAFSASGKTRRVSRSIRLTRRGAGAPAQPSSSAGRRAVR
ncbi:MAG: trypsin-like serine protease [Actinobacteria bacterium]|nr:trypsin-like serine protease [Actinomycetota bacterium]